MKLWRTSDKLQDPGPVSIQCEVVERVSCFKFLGTHITEDLTWATHTFTVISKAENNLHFLRKLRGDRLPQNILLNFYQWTMKSILIYCITTWYASCTRKEQKALQIVIKIAQNITRTQLPTVTSTR